MLVFIIFLNFKHKLQLIKFAQILICLIECFKVYQFNLATYSSSKLAIDGKSFQFVHKSAFFLLMIEISKLVKLNFSCMSYECTVLIYKYTDSIKSIEQPHFFKWIFHKILKHFISFIFLQVAHFLKFFSYFAFRNTPGNEMKILFKENILKIFLIKLYQSTNIVLLDSTTFAKVGYFKVC